MAGSQAIAEAIEQLTRALAEMPTEPPDMFIAEGREWRLRRGANQHGEKRRWYECQLPSGELLRGIPEAYE